MKRTGVCRESLLGKFLFFSSDKNIMRSHKFSLLFTVRYDIIKLYFCNHCSIEEEVQDMAVSYKKLFKILIDRDMKKKEFRDYVGISYSTMSKLEKGENTTVEVLEKICLKLGCRD